MVYGLPACVLMVPICWRILLWMFPPELERLPVSRQQIATRLEALGPLSPAEWRTIVVFTFAIALWLGTPLIESWSHGTIALPAEAVGLGAGLCLFLPGMRVLTWKETERDIEWGGIVLIAAGLSLGKAVFDSGAARWLAWVLLGGIASIPDVLRPFSIVIGVAVLRLLFSSNTVAASIITPILIALARDLHLDAWAVVAPAAFSATLGFVLVSQGPTTIIPYGAGYFTIKDMAKAGLLMTVAAAACIGITIVVVDLFIPAR
jgi:sodium-dependent dicarboxylate transporter 2/3/5